MWADGLVEITSEDELREILGAPTPRDAGKVRTSLHEHDRAWLAASPFCVVSTAAADGRCDASPKGDPAGFTLVLDDTTIVVPERPGNRRTDGFRNVLGNPHVGLLYVVPGRGDTLRINGRARLVRDAPFFDRLVVNGHRPPVALLVEIEEVFYHCSKSFLRSALWKPESWDPQAAPSRARIARSLERPDEALADLEQYYGPQYGARLYG
ncbi:pyridoxamine 5'-phosphate oxidase family protein [Streptomyces sp. CBMA123]|uniref:pyridoxamine 5'-phosphate oxidase family protein n=1 Tax=Streptomyces sp. CBMA123 TaxID=1896313 RepID=UPI00166210C7|nr:pyridoxamine 5'-phosphate oxidase family protein [Streptomyces sp. CBMA123]MBD0692907.1 pyridoxamine 5'-phosphate oxidase [Streptomyces sp. CBMA123]